MEWPSDAVFAEVWLSRHVYQTLNNPKVVHILKRLNTTYIGNKHEHITIDGALTVEHILPQQWTEKWPLPDGTKGLTPVELWNADQGDSRVEASRRRNAVLQTFGNLTILTQPLNSAASNSTWKDKKNEIMQHSLLPINQQLHEIDVWDEEAINKRGNVLLDRALKLWPRE